MNYRHHYHAGNFADVFKHAVLALALSHLRQKEKPFFVLDTHAGAGLYNLGGPEAQKTGEWQGGIGRILAAGDPPPELAPYSQALAALARKHGVGTYPGSPLIVPHFMRAHDRLVACELHPTDGAALSHALAGDRRAKVLQSDGYVALKALLPPRERRGLVLIDPPFERKDEFSRLVRGFLAAYRRFATGVYLIWYPIKDPSEADKHLEPIRALPKAQIIRAELLRRETQDTTRLNGAGLLIANPPWTLENSLAPLLFWLARTLAEEKATFRIEWLKGGTQLEAKTA